MNEQIINKISELMQVSYDKAVELYPIVKIQFLWYEFFDKIIKILTAFFIIEAAAFLFFVFGHVYDYDEFGYKKYIKITVWVILITVALYLLAYGASLILASDIVFIKGILGGK